MDVAIKRIYDQVSQDDGFRVLVDRLWPRGIEKNEAKIDFWQKEIAPSDKIRKWFHGGEIDWKQFKEKYYFELSKNDSVQDFIEEIEKHPKVTFVYSARDTEENNAIALKEYLRRS